MNTSKITTMTEITMPMMPPIPSSIPAEMEKLESAFGGGGALVTLLTVQLGLVQELVKAYQAA
jgi:hypothetical protein